MGDVRLGAGWRECCLALFKSIRFVGCHKSRCIDFLYLHKLEYADFFVHKVVV